MRLSEELQRYAIDIIKLCAPDGGIIGSEYVAKNPTRPDSRQGSFKYNVEKHTWCDFAVTGAKGSDVISYFAYCKGVLYKEAAKILAVKYGLNKQKKKKPRVDGILTLVENVPDDAPKPPTDKFVPVKDDNDKIIDWKKYKIDHYYPYYDPKSRLLGYVVRYMTEAGKETPPLTLYINEDKEYVWRFKNWPNPTPIYNLDKLYKYNEAKVIVVEGEKCADSLQNLIEVSHKEDKIVAIAWQGGGKRARFANWAGVFERKVVLFPDFDWKKHVDTDEVLDVEQQPGYRAMSDIGNILINNKCEVEIVIPSKEFPDTWDVDDAIKDGWDLKKIGRFVEQNKKVFIPTKIVEEEKPAEKVANNYFRCLGYAKELDKILYYYMPKGTRQIICYRADQHSRNNLLSIAPLKYWERNYSGKHGPDYVAATNDMIRENENNGVFDPNKRRGRGAWYDNKDCVLHLGNKLVVNNKTMGIEEYQSRYFYEAAPPLEYIDAQPLTTDKSRHLFKICKMLFFENPMYCDYLAGWLAVAPVCGALKTRPHIWLTGGAGTGKTFILEHIVKPCLGSSALYVTADTSGPAIRISLGADALPVFIDEFEGNTESAQRKIQDILELARTSFSDSSAKMLKAPSGRLTSYIMRACFLFASVTVNLSNFADKTRIMVLSLRRPFDTENLSKGDHFARLVDMTQILTEDYCSALRARTIGLIPQIRKNSTIFGTLISEKIGSKRTGDQIGPLLAGAYSLCNDGYISIEEAQKYVNSREWSENIDTMNETDESLLLDTILQVQLRSVNNSDVSVAQLLNDLKNTMESSPAMTVTSDGVPNDEYPQDRILRQFGIKYDQENNMVWIHGASRSMKKALTGTPWTNCVTKILSRIDGAVIKTVRINYTPAYSVGLRWEDVFK